MISKVFSLYGILHDWGIYSTVVQKEPAKHSIVVSIFSGAPNIIIRSQKPPQLSSETGRVKIFGLKRLDYDRIMARIDGPGSPLVITTIERAVPMREIDMVKIRFFDRESDVQLLGITSE